VRIDRLVDVLVVRPGSGQPAVLPSLEIEPSFNRFPLINLRKQHEVFAQK